VPARRPITARRSVDVERIEPWNVPGRDGHPPGRRNRQRSPHRPRDSSGQDAVAILLTQVGLTSPTPPAIMREFWEHTAAHSGQPA
jgi:hypothetical protein